MKRTSSQSGFTLMEVLVALAVLATAMLAIVKASSSNVAGVDHVRNKTFAHWVATNQLIALELDTQWPTIGTKTGNQEMGGYEWYWEAKISKTDNVNLRSAEVRIFLNENDEDSVTDIQGLLIRPEFRQ